MRKKNCQIGKAIFIKLIYNYNHGQNPWEGQDFSLLLSPPTPPPPPIQCCAKLNCFIGKLLCYLPTLNRGRGLYKRRWNYFSCALTEAGWSTALMRFIYITFPTTFVYDCSSLFWPKWQCFTCTFFSCNLHGHRRFLFVLINGPYLYQSLGLLFNLYHVQLLSI